MDWSTQETAKWSDLSYKEWKLGEPPVSNMGPLSTHMDSSGYEVGNNQLCS